VGQTVRGSVFYIVLSFLLQLGIRFNHDGLMNKKFFSVFFENFAPDTIMILATAGGMLTVIRMMATGPNGGSPLIKNWFFHYVIFPIVNTGKVFTITGLGMLVGLFAATLTPIFPPGYTISTAKLIGIFTFCLAGFGVMEYFGKYGYTTIISECVTQFMLAVLLVILPCLYVWAN